VKKKNIATSKDKKDWIAFTKEIGNLRPKESDVVHDYKNRDKLRRIDLHGLSLIEANNKIENFIIESFNEGYRKLLVVTGRGSRSKTMNNPYISEELSLIRYSIPEYIKRNNNLTNKIIKISKADRVDGGEGAIYIFLKNNRKL